MKTHWLYGMGPNKEVKFNVEVDKDDECNTCIHSNVCGHDMNYRCENFQGGCSGGIVNGTYTCGACSHHYTKYDDKDSIPCFKCRDYSPDQAQIDLYFDVAECLSDLEIKPKDLPMLINFAKSDYWKENGVEYKSHHAKLPLVPKKYIVDKIRQEETERQAKRKK